MILIYVRNLNYGAMALYPFVLVRSDVSKQRLPVLLNHEKIHLRQQLELLLLPFYLVYLLHYLINLLRFRNHQQAYRNIVFEKEAFKHESDLSYLQKRKLFAWMRNG